MFHLNMIDLQLDKAFYHPGEKVYLEVWVDSQVESPAPARVHALITHLSEKVDQMYQEVVLEGGRQRFELSFTPPLTAPRGYGLDLEITNQHGELVASYSTAFDVLDTWLQHPRYGFLSEFQPGRSDGVETMAVLARYRLNGLQFYDWMYRHEQLLTGQEPYVDLLGRQLSRQTIEALIQAAHQRNIGAMPYTAVYGASLAFYRDHPEWALLNATGEPTFFGEDFLVIMDPRPGSPWSTHLLDQFDQVLENTGFDGIHLDQYGDPKEGYDDQGQRFDLAGPLADFINATKGVVQARRPEGAVVFNAVTNWPIESVAPAAQDLVYIEVWPPYSWYNDLHNLIVEGRRLGQGKPVVLAAYQDPAQMHNVLLVDAVIFSSGGGHIELGENFGLLSDPYFPKFETVSAELAEPLRRMYNFAVRYQNLIGPQVSDVTADYHHQISVEGVSTAPGAMKDKVWPIVRKGEGFLALSLINLLGVESPEWKEPIAAPPTPLGATNVQIGQMTQPVSRVWLATPDDPDLRAKILEFTQIDDHLSFQIPSLKNWDLIVIEWSE